MLTNQSAVQLVLTFLDGKALIMAVDLLHSIIVKSAVSAKLGSSAQMSAEREFWKMRRAGRRRPHASSQRLGSNSLRLCEKVSEYGQVILIDRLDP